MRKNHGIKWALNMFVIAFAHICANACTREMCERVADVDGSYTRSLFYVADLFMHTRTHNTSGPHQQMPIELHTPSVLDVRARNQAHHRCLYTGTFSQESPLLWIQMGGYESNLLPVAHPLHRNIIPKISLKEERDSQMASTWCFHAFQLLLSGSG